MKPFPLFAKIAVLSIFIILLTGFVAYRSGAFDKLLAGKRSGILPAMENNSSIAYHLDTIPKVDTPPPPPRIMSSSKSMVMTDSYEYVFKNGELKKKLKKKKVNKKDTAVFKRPIIFSGSKSGPVITPQPRVVLPDTTKNKQ